MANIHIRFDIRQNLPQTFFNKKQRVLRVDICLCLRYFNQHNNNPLTQRYKIINDELLE